ncbi:MAG: pilus assembly protein N-terminal domain-containing protein [Asticcacaulis sp.]
MKTRVMTGIAVAMGLLSASAALAGAKVVVEKNHSTRVTLSAPAGSVIVGNPAIADVTVVDSRTIYIVGRGFGRSSVTVTDSAGRTIFDGDVVVGTPVDGGITVYKGLKPSTLVCARTCTEQTDGEVTSTVSSPSS